MAKQRQSDQRDTLEQQQNSKKVRLSNAADLQQVERSSKKAAASSAERLASTANEGEGATSIDESAMNSDSRRLSKRPTGSQSVAPTSSPTPRQSLPPVMRRNVKEFEYQYVSLCLSPTDFSTTTTSTPNPRSVHTALVKSMQSLHGLVGASFHFDVLAITAQEQSDQDGDTIARSTSTSFEALLRVPTEYLSTLLTTLAMGIDDLPSDDDSTAWRVRLRKGNAVTPVWCVQSVADSSDDGGGGSGSDWLRRMEASVFSTDSATIT